MERHADLPATASDEPTDVADRLIRLGQAHEDIGEYDSALIFYRNAIAVAPGHAIAHMNAGNALGKLGRWDEGLEQQRMAVDFAPDHAPARFNLGAFMFNRGALEGASEELLEASRLSPGMIEAPILLADIYELLARFNDAEAEFRRAFAINPEHAGAMVNFGWFCVRRGRMEEAAKWLRRARTANPELTGAEGQMLFAMNFCPELSPNEIAREHMLAGVRLSRTSGERFVSWTNTAEPDRRLRVGYVSGDFGPHPVGFLIRPIFEHHDRSRFEVYAYSNSSQSNSIESVLRTNVDQWRTIADLEDAVVVNQIRKDEVDLLVDLSGHTTRGRLEIFARHPAPVQVTWLGYLNTTGLPAMDYRIVDWYTDPDATTESLHTEHLTRMPHSQWCYPVWENVDPVAIPHPDHDRVVFGSFNQYAKIGDASLSLWSRILTEVPLAELVVMDVRTRYDRQFLFKRMAAHGIDTTRVATQARVPLLAYYGAIGNVDIALDTTPYNGATTALDTLWMGVPVVAMQGDRGISRGTYSILRTLGANDLIARSADEYVSLNIRLALDTTWRTRLRASLRTRLASSPLMDGEGFTRALEEKYREMWRAWSDSRSPRA